MWSAAPYLRILALAALLLPAAARAQSPHSRPLQFRAGALILDLETDLRVDGGTFRGSDLELEKDLGLPRSPAIPFGEFIIGVRHRIHLRFFQSTRVGDERLEENTRFNDEVIGVVGDTAETRSELRTADLMFSTRLLGKGALRLDLYVGGKYFHLKHRITNEERPLSSGVTTSSSSDTVDTGVLYAGVGGHLLVTQEITLYTRFLFTRFTRNLFDVQRFTYVDFSFGLTYRIYDFINLSAEYRLLRLDIAHENSGFRTVYDVLGQGAGISVLLAF